MADPAVNVKIGAQDRSKAAFNSAQSNLTKLSQKATLVTGAVAGVTAAFSAVSGILGKVNRLVGENAERLDNLAKSARAADLGYETFQGLRIFAEEAGVKVSRFDRVLTTFNTRVIQASEGLTTYQRAFDKVGFSITDADGKLRTGEKGLLAYFDALQMSGDRALSLASSQELLSAGFARFTSALIDSNIPLTDFIDLQREMGQFVAPELLNLAESMNDQFARTGRVWDNLVAQTLHPLNRQLEIFSRHLQNVLVQGISIESQFSLNNARKEVEEFFAIFTDPTVPAALEFNAIRTAIQDSASDLAELEKIREDLLDATPSFIDRALGNVSGTFNPLFTEPLLKLVEAYIEVAQAAQRADAAVAAIGGEGAGGSGPARGFVKLQLDAYEKLKTNLEDVRKQLMDTTGLEADQVRVLEQQEEALQKQLLARQGIKTVQETTGKTLLEQARARIDAEEKSAALAQKVRDLKLFDLNIELELGNITQQQYEAEAIKLGLIKEVSEEQDEYLTKLKAELDLRVALGEITAAQAERILRIAEQGGEGANRRRIAAEQEASAFSQDLAVGFVDSLREGNLKDTLDSLFGNVADTFVAKLEQRLHDRLADFFFNRLFGGEGGGGGGGLLGSVGSFLFGGFRQGGGSVLGNHAYIVGERGPELYIPRFDGQVLDGRQTGQALSRDAGVNNNLTFNMSLVGSVDQQTLSAFRRQRREVTKLMQGQLYERRAIGRG